MARLAIFASGNGSNFQAIAEEIQKTGHTISCLICDRKKAYSFERAKNLGIKSYYVPYFERSKEAAEQEIAEIIEKEKADIIALAGFMRILSHQFVEKYKNRIVNIHPSLLPKYPGTGAIEKSYNSGDEELGITIHYVDGGVDTGPIIRQESFKRKFNEPLEEIEKKIHNLEYTAYPEVIKNLLDSYQ
ncbi:MAG: phosphoribosylglycinamide formyltransferase [Spirochaetes bacterium]|nr:phosphoribosylglycinamide formyltransferase [Spirochaetota bacterium]